MGGINGIPQTEIRAWALNTGRHPTPQDIDALTLLDDIFVAVALAGEAKRAEATTSR